MLRLLSTVMQRVEMLLGRLFTVQVRFGSQIRHALHLSRSDLQTSGMQDSNGPLCDKQ